VVGSPAEVLDKLMSYRELGMEAFILSGYPHIDEAERFARLVLPHIPHGPLA
jgi:alkanesulfonate monooxygenase